MTIHQSKSSLSTRNVGNGRAVVRCFPNSGQLGSSDQKCEGCARKWRGALRDDLSGTFGGGRLCEEDMKMRIKLLVKLNENDKAELEARQMVLLSE
jgi:hypothetical protein